MPAPRIRKSRSLIAQRLLLAILLTVVLGSAAGSAMGAPIVKKADAYHTVTWTFATSDNLTVSGLDRADGTLILPWETSGIAWDAEDFALNGSLADGLTMAAGGLQLSADARNPVDNADFAAGSGWQFISGLAGQVNAVWDSVEQTAFLGHEQLAAETTWDNMDLVEESNNWTSVGSGGASIAFRQGVGTMEVEFSTEGTGTYVGVRRSSPVDWSSGDRLVVWVNSADVDPPVSFNVTASVGGVFRTTPTVPLLLGWQELSIDLSPFGNADNRSSLTDLTFRLNAQGARDALVYFDGARLGSLRQFDDAGSLVQLIRKANETTPAAGSAYLSFDWSVSDLTGILLAEAAVSLTGPSGAFERAFARDASPGWETFSADVSPASTSAGDYVLSFRYRVVVESTAASRTSLRVDNVSLAIPDRENATFVSEPITLTRASQLLNVSWSASTPPGTSARLSLRSGNETDPGAASWSPWAQWTSPGVHSLSLPGAHHAQLRLDLNTTNASRSPVVGSFGLDTRHRVAEGFVESDVFTPLSGFARWRTLEGNWSGPTSTNIEFSTGDDSFWTPVPDTGDIGLLPARLRWNASFSTTDGLSTPELISVDAIYEIQVVEVPILAIVLPYSVALIAITSAAWIVHEIVIRRMFSIDDVFLISRDGRLLMHNTRRMRADRDEDILSGMLSAILSFVRDADPEENGDLRRFELGGKTTLLERAKDVFVCVVYSGRVPRWASKDLRRFVTDLESEFGEAFAHWNGAKEDLPDIKEFTRRFVLRVRYRSPRNHRARAA